jgi:hypothetical protein
MPPRPQPLWTALIRTLIGLLALLLVLALALSFYPGLLRGALRAVPGLVVEFPTPGPTPPPPLITAAAGTLPAGYLAFSGETSIGGFSCGFLMELPDGQRVGFSAAHAIPALPPDTPAEFRTAAGTRAAALKGQIAYGQTFRQAHFTMDYVIWALADAAAAEYFVKPDARGQGQPGERVWVLGRYTSPDGGSNRRPGVVLSSTPEQTWIQLDDAFDPGGYSGCPVVSQFTGRVIGMAVSGANQPPVIMGLHPVGSLVEKAQAALQNR